MSGGTLNMYVTARFEIRDRHGDGSFDTFAMDIEDYLSEDQFAELVSLACDRADRREAERLADHEKWRIAADERRARALPRLTEVGRGKVECVACGDTAVDNLVVDHIVPRSRGGGNELSNLQVLCNRCNSSKGAKLPHEWAGRRRA